MNEEEMKKQKQRERTFNGLCASEYKFHEQLSKEDFAIFAYYICNNFIQMDGLTRCIPCENPYDYKLWDGKTDKEKQKNLAKIEQYVTEQGMIWSCFFDWGTGGLVRFRDLEKK